MKLAALGLLLIPLTACGSEADIPAMQDEIAHGIEKQTKVNDVTVDCPDSIDWKAGGEFHCFGKAHGQQFRVTVSMENDAGEWSWQVS